MTIERNFLNEQEQREMTQEIIQKFNAFLEAKGMEVINVEKQPIEYKELEDSILDTLIGYKVIQDFRKAGE